MIFEYPTGTTSELLADVSFYWPGDKISNAKSSFWISAAEGQVPDIIERNVMKDIFDTMGGVNWTTKTNWPAAGSWAPSYTAAQMDTWAGIIVQNGDITGLSFQGNNLVGPIPASISNLKSLQTINFMINKVNGSIPSTLTSLINLKELKLYDNLLTGSIPADIGSMVNLEYLTLAKNSFTGTIPQSLTSLTKLYWLGLYRNPGLTGPLPAGFTDLVNLTDLYIYDTGVDGELPQDMGKLSKLVHFWGYRNKWSGNLPATLGNITTLQNLYLYSNNKFSGEIPENYRNLTNLRNLWLHDNELTGELPDWIAELTKMVVLSLGDNKISGNIPPAYKALTNLTQLYLPRMELTGEIPSTLQSLTKLNYIDVQGNKLEGAIPQWLVMMPALKDHWFNNNDFTGYPDVSSRTDKGSLSIHIENNALPIANIERYFTAPNTHPFKVFTYGPQKYADFSSSLYVPLNDHLVIEAPDGGREATYTWEKLIDGTWTDVGYQNQGTANPFIIEYVSPAQAGKYRYSVSNTWLPAFVFSSGEITVTITDAVSGVEAKRFYNGIISAVRWRTDKPYKVSAASGLEGIYTYSYDDKYQIKDATWGTAGIGPFDQPVVLYDNKYRLTGMEYDPNGNIKTLKRYNEVGAVKHNFSYSYNQNKNTLTSVSGYAHSYEYNNLGQMIGEEKVEGINQYVEYDVSGKVTKVYASKNAQTGALENLKVEFLYDDRGFRLAKVNHQTSRTTTYIRDGSGNVVGIFEQEGIIARQSDGRTLVVKSEPLVLTEVPVYASGKVGTYYPGQDGSTTYEITDHLGNVRALVRDNVTVYTATMEDTGQPDLSNPRVEELQYFQNLFETEKTDVNMNHTAAGVVANPNKSAYLYWVDGMSDMEASDKAVGPSIALKVNAGDKINLEAWARYQRKPNYARDFALTALTSMLGQSFAYKGGFEGYTISEASTSLQAALTSAGYGNDEADVSRPFAYLNYIVYDKNMAYKTAGWVRVTDDGAGFDPGEEAAQNAHEHLKLGAPVSINEEGYIYVWVSNESEDTKVWFDDLTVTHTATIQTQATDYETWGDVLREQKTDASVYRFAYQGQFSEKDPETGWNHFELREYDPIIGRWLQKDPAGQFYSPYVGMGNNPVGGTDADGGFTDFRNTETGEVHHVEDGFTTTVDVSPEMFDAIVAGNFVNPVKHTTVPGRPGSTVQWTDTEYLKLLFTAVSLDIASHNDLKMYEAYRNTYGGNFFWQGLDATFSDELVQASRISPMARAFARNLPDVNLGLKAVLWRDNILRDNGLNNAKQHQIATSVLSGKASIFGAFGITTCNEVINLWSQDLGSGNFWNAIMGRRANNGNTTAFEWSDLGNNIKGIWNSMAGF